MKLIIVALSGIALLVLNASPAFARNWQDGEAGVKWNQSCDFQGHDIECPTGVRSEDCGRMCAYNSRCTHFTAHSDRCCLKHSSESLVEIHHEWHTCGFVPNRSSQPY